MNRLYVVESAFTLTGGMADHRKKLPSQHIFSFVMALVDELVKQGVPVAGFETVDKSAEINIGSKWINALAKDLVANKGQSLIVAGRHQPPQVHAAVFAINDALRNSGKTVMYRAAKYELLDKSRDISDLTSAIMKGDIDSLVMLGANPVYYAPTDLDFSEAIIKLKHSIHLGLHADETVQKCEWHLPQAHFLESWGDAQALDGTLSVVQPMIAPLFNGHSDIELMNFLTTAEDVGGYELVRTTWKPVIGNSDFEKKWRRILHDGVKENSQLADLRPKTSAQKLTDFLSNNPVLTKKVSQENIEVVFKPSAAIYDGRFANNGWLQELPDGVSKLAWDNAVLMSNTTAKALGIKAEDLVLLDLNGREAPMPVWIIPGHADYSVTVTLGYGRKSAGRVGSGVGFDAYRIRSSQQPDMAYGLSIQRTIDTYPMSNTQDHNSMEGRPLIREADLAEYRDNSNFAQEMVEHPPLKSLWDEHSYDEGNQWGMTIDLNSCTGCNACTIACQSENNIPIIGKEQVKEGREMHWLRLDRYFSGDEEDPEMVFQPVGCQHCENAPCEQVCPVAATVHDSEGLNVMTYNRCVGTRYCSNNCPYKVRRFNFFNYTNELPEIVQMAQNPDVTVRSRGVMEKCTYCLQRISAAKIQAKKDDKALKDGDVVTACQQACPTKAIEFGNIIDPDSKIAQSKKSDRRYEMLAELNIKPRTSYLAKLRNPNPELSKG
jgi:molybdopterin-containing oxidoreductase family iron-sulfur binding subunit